MTFIDGNQQNFENIDGRILGKRIMCIYRIFFSHGCLHWGYDVNRSIRRQWKEKAWFP
jgi:hypothetical protein